MVIALVITVVFGAMIANPPFSIVGAVGVVGGTVLFALAATWTTRTSWGQTDWRDIPVSDEVAMRKFRRVALIQCLIAPLMIGGGVWRVATGDAAGFINVFVGASPFMCSPRHCVRRKRSVAKNQHPKTRQPEPWG
jgi:hypothetical protein